MTTSIFLPHIMPPHIITLFPPKRSRFRRHLSANLSTFLRIKNGLYVAIVQASSAALSARKRQRYVTILSSSCYSRSTGPRPIRNFSSLLEWGMQKAYCIAVTVKLQRNVIYACSNKTIACSLFCLLRRGISIRKAN